MKGIIQKEKECFACGCVWCLEEHHVFPGNPGRKHSEKYGMKVWLCQMHHRDAKQGVHGQNTDLKFRLKKIAQLKFEEKWGHELFMDTFKKDYREEWWHERQN